MYESISVVIPVYNSQDILAELLRRLESVLKTLGNSYEIILVNDGSRDNSWEVICELSKNYSSLRGINLMRNYGQHNALLCGIREAQGELIVTMDDDLQHPPEEMCKLLEKIDEGSDVVYGVPVEEQHGIWRDLASQVTKMVLKNAMGAHTARNISAFRVFRAQLRQAFTGYQNPFVSIDVLLTWATTRFSTIPVQHDPRRVGVSNYTVRKLIRHALNMMTGFSTLPLELAGVIGLTFTFLGLIVFGYVLVRYMLDGSVVPGFPFLASIVAIFSGAQLFAIGIIGEYLARMHFRTMERPPYSIRSTCSQK